MRNRNIFKNIEYTSSAVVQEYPQLFKSIQQPDIDPIMLQNTFMHIQSIGAVTEQKLWDSGINNWDLFTDDISIPLSGKRKYLLQKGID